MATAPQSAIDFEPPVPWVGMDRVAPDPGAPDEEAPPPRSPIQRARVALRAWRKTLLGALGVLVILVGLGAYGARVLQSRAAPRRMSDIALSDGTTTIDHRAAPYRVLSTLTIRTGQTLRVLSGAVLAFAQGTALVVRGGALVVEGAVDAPVLLTSLADPAIGGPGASAGAWQGIETQTDANGTPGRIMLDNADIRFAGTAKGAAITCETGGVTLTNSVQSDSAGGGLLATSGCWGQVAQSTFERDAGDAADIATTALRFSDNLTLGSAVNLP